MWRVVRPRDGHKLPVISRGKYSKKGAELELVNGDVKRLCVLHVCCYSSIPIYMNVRYLYLAVVNYIRRIICYILCALAPLHISFVCSCVDVMFGGLDSACCSHAGQRQGGGQESVLVWCLTLVREGVEHIACHPHLMSTWKKW